MGRKPIDKWQVGTSHYAVYAEGLCKMLTADGHLLHADPSWSEVQALSTISNATDASFGQKFVRWQGGSLHGRRLSLELKYGRVGNYSDAMGPMGDTPISDKAPSRMYRAELLLPETEGSGLLAVEAISRSAPMTPLITWMGAASFIKEQGQVWWRLKATQATDAQYLADLIEKSEHAEVSMKHVGIDEIGDRPRTQYRLHAPLSTRQRSHAVDWVMDRIKGKGSLEGMLQIVGVRSTGDLDFTEGHIKLDDGETTTRVGLSDVREIFTYPISTNRPDTETWESAVRSRFRALEPNLVWE
jgi:hypothetical protein